MSIQERQPTRVSLSLGSTTRLTEFDFSKISLSLDRDLAPAENPIDAYRDIKALLERLVTEFQAGKLSSSVNENHASTHDFKPKESPRVSDNHGLPPRVETSKPAGLTVETVRERLAKWLPDLEILDGFAVKPKRYLGETWSEVNEVIRSLSGKWQKGLKSTDGAWQIPK